MNKAYRANIFKTLQNWNLNQKINKRYLRINGRVSERKIQENGTP